MGQKNGGYYDPSAKPGDFRIILGTCCVCPELGPGKVISVLTHVVEFDTEDGPDDCQIWCQYGAEGLQTMMRALAESAYPVPDIPDNDGIRANLNYHWHAFYANGESVRQWCPDPDGGPPIEKNFGDLDPHRVARFFLLPKDENSRLPCYCLDREQGFLMAKRRGQPYEAMVDTNGAPLPMPSVPFHLEYCFRPHITLMYDPSRCDAMPVHVRQELGWRVDTLHGDPCDTWFILGIEDDDGGWQVMRKEPEESRHLLQLPWDVVRTNLTEEEERESRVIEAEHGVRIVDAFGGSGI